MNTLNQIAAGPRRVLLVDDETQVRESLRRVFEIENFDVAAAGGSVEAMNSLKTMPCDVAVIDYNLQGETGQDLARQLRGAHPQMPVVMITACPDRAPASVLEDCVALLAKPLDLSVLLETVRTAAVRNHLGAMSAPEVAVQC